VADHFETNPRPQTPGGSGNPTCRLCEGELVARFKCRVLGRLDVSYFQCAACLSLQTQTPTWLEEAYGAGNLAAIDAGGAQRSLFNAAASYFVARMFGLANVIDFGGGDGLLCRLLRDQGINAYVRDQFATASYAKGFTEPNFATADLLTAFEVLEHFAEPRSDLDGLFACQPRFLLLTTELYQGQDSQWWYLVPESGQHVFFYSRRALQLIGERYGYDVRICRDYVLLARNTETATWRLAVAQYLLRGKFLRLVLAAMFLRPARGALQDLQRLRDRAKDPVVGR